jgi:hypothetical protein
MRGEPLQLAMDNGLNRFVQSNPLQHPLFPLVEVDLDPVAVELDFVEPLVAGRRLGLQRGQLRLDESRHCRRGGRRNNSTGPILRISETIRPPPCSAHQIDQTPTLRHSTVGYLSPAECERNVESA